MNILGSLKPLASRIRMTFIEVVRKLRDLLDVPADVPLPLAVKQMSDMMGIPTETEDGTAVALPNLVEALVEVLDISGDGGEESIGDSSDRADFDVDDGGGDMVDSDDAGSVSVGGATPGSKRPAVLAQRTVGSFFGPGITKKYSKGKLIESAIARPHERVAVNSGLMKCVCGQTFNHPPALNIHRKFCRAVAFHAAVCDNEFDGDDGETGGENGEGGAADADDAAADEAPRDEHEESCSDKDPIKRRKINGEPKKSGMKQGQHRTPYTVYFKYTVALEYEAFCKKKEEGLITNPLERCSELFCGLSTSNIWNWFKQKETLRKVLMHETSGVEQRKKNRAGQIVHFKSTSARRQSLHGGRGAAFAPAEAELISRFKAKRRAGKRVNERWLCIQMRKLIRLHYGDEAADRFKASHGWLIRLASRFDITLRRANNSKNQSVAERLPKIKRWHARLRRRLKVGPPGRLHVKWGRWLPKNRLSIDQELLCPRPPPPPHKHPCRSTSLTTTCPVSGSLQLA